MTTWTTITAASSTWQDTVPGATTWDDGATAWDETSGGDVGLTVWDAPTAATWTTAATATTSWSAA